MTHNIYRDGKVHVLSAECATCIFKPAARPVEGARVAGMVRDTMDEPGATVVCHSTLYKDGVHNAICRGWYDRLGDRDPVLGMARAMSMIQEQEAPT
jgi:hypothetical protein